MPVKVDPYVVEELAGLGLVLWEAKHPKHAVTSPKTGKPTLREDKSWVLVALAGPGVEETYGGGATLRAAVDSAIRHSPLCDRVPGLRGAVLRAERALFDLALTMATDRYARGDDLDDSIPF